MGEITKADKYLLDQIRKGDEESWSALIDRYRGRLLSFSSAKLPQHADAEDIVQDTFIAFISGLGSFQGRCSLETFLFSILRRKIIDSYRGKKSKNVGLIQDLYESISQGDSSVFGNIAGSEQTASWYVRRDEQHELRFSVLADALTAMVDGMKSDLNFRDLKTVELLFYCQLSNNSIADILKTNNKSIAVLKHRCLKQISEYIDKSDVSLDYSSGDFESLLTEVWESQRLSCPKRSTIGGYLLNTLDSKWHDYVDFHLNTLGCHFCRANLDDLKNQNAKTDTQYIQRRIMESTVGFLHKPHQRQ